MFWDLGWEGIEIRNLYGMLCLETPELEICLWGRIVLTHRKNANVPYVRYL